MHFKTAIAVLGLLFISSVGCATALQEKPAWLDERIAQLKKSPPGNPPFTIWQYRYQGRTVYYFPPQCCDIPSALLDSAQKSICSPDGGFAGDGDGKCTDFFTTRSEEKLIWRDSRSR